MIERIGYACLNENTLLRYQTCRKADATQERIYAVVAHNLAVLREMALWNEQHGIELYRVSSSVVPFGGLVWDALHIAEQFAEEFAEVKHILRRSQQRFSVHPGQYTVLNSLHAEVVKNSIADLHYHTELLRVLGGTQCHKMVLHIGGAYGDKHAAMARFATVANRLDDRIRQHLILENDDKLFAIDDVLALSRQTRLPVVFDFFHHQVHGPQQPMSLTHILAQVATTWSADDGRMILHYSQQAFGKKAGSHSATITAQEWCNFTSQITEPCDVMLEVKDKNRSAIKAMVLQQGDRHALTTEWARFKYLVLSKSQKIYRDIRDLLKQPNCAAEAFYSLVEKALALPENRGEAVNAYTHIWGYFKNHAHEKQRSQFFAVLDRYHQGAVSQKVVNRTVRNLLLQYPNDYLQHSYLLEH